jgi:hypothetical protein
MPRVKQGRRRASRRSRTAARAFVFRPAPVAEPQMPRRGVKLKTMSRLTLLFALVCLGAFMAGRPPVAADGHFEFATARTKPARAGRGRLRNDDARRVLLGLRR